MSVYKKFLVSEIERVLIEKNLTQSQASKISGISQPEISRALKTGAMKFEKMAALLDSLGVVLVVSTKPKS